MILSLIKCISILYTALMMYYKLIRIINVMNEMLKQMHQNLQNESISRETFITINVLANNPYLF